METSRIIELDVYTQLEPHEKANVLAKVKDLQDQVDTLLKSIHEEKLVKNAKCVEISDTKERMAKVYYDGRLVGKRSLSDAEIHAILNPELELPQDFDPEMIDLQTQNLVGEYEDIDFVPC